MLSRVRPLLLVGFSVLAACRTTPNGERWVIPKGYVGWLRLDYGVAGQPALPVENGRYLVRMPSQGRVQTSSVNTGRIASIEYVVEDSHGRHTLESFPKELSPRYGVQHSYSVAGGSGSHKPVVGFACVFVGTRSDFRASGRNCDAWELGQSEPPKFRRHLVVPR